MNALTTDFQSTTCDFSCPTCGFEFPKKHYLDHITHCRANPLKIPERWIDWEWEIGNYVRFAHKDRVYYGCISMKSRSPRLGLGYIIKFVDHDGDAMRTRVPERDIISRKVDD